VEGVDDPVLAERQSECQIRAARRQGTTAIVSTIVGSWLKNKDSSVSMIPSMAQAGCGA
jgi:hypothetical protein